ncbi:hypothetical protein SAMN05421823_11838 [Catalinimonas alkaloidigena]|uniref:Uncharacterized protein n=1 Tax=Catalinimonas alkaloidigena TaxID=1075417 RepID=A0A1G9UYH7_9BACT|nr:hypothetical protein SAMN05421823_11838 [Catalinimonas alkaloidigena]
MHYGLSTHLLLVLQKCGSTISERADRIGLSKKQISKTMRHGDGKRSRLALIAAVSLAHSKNKALRAARNYPG